MSDTNEIQLKKGVLEMLVLALLARRESYAYEIANELSELIGMGEGTIYPLMRRLQNDGLVKTYLMESSAGPSRKYYRLTQQGRETLAAQRAQWDSFSAAIITFLEQIG
jgi:PadR family transcriptional regulator PadR